MRFAQGHTPQSLASPDAVPEHDALSSALKKARKVKSDNKNKWDFHSDVELEPEHLAILREAVLRLTRLPAALLPVPEDLSLLDLLSASSTLTRARGNTIQGESLAVIFQALEEADTSGLLRDIPNLPPLSTEPGPPRPFDYGATIKRARIGVMIELSTIPLYLYAMYSVKQTTSNGIRVRELLGVILQQEMLHLALSGNLLSALGGSVTLYDSRIVPMFPGALLCSKIPVNLEALSSGSIGRFMEIEAPVDAGRPSNSDDRNVLGSQYDSIGQLYEELVLSVRGHEDQLFTNNLDNQFVGQDFFDGQLFAITDRSTALRALGIIIEQGEGNLNVANSHYEVFSKLYSGPACNVYKVPTNPKTRDYGADSYLHRLSLSFDAGYCYLLQTIQRVWETGNISNRLILFRNIHGIMNNVLTPLAELLVQQDFMDGCAAPCFNYYPMLGSVAKDPLIPWRLYQALVKEVALAAAAAASDDSIGRAGQEAAGKVDTKVQAASTKAGAAAPSSADATKAAAIAGRVQTDGTAVRDAQPSEVARIVGLATKMAKDAVQVALHTQATARLGSDTNIKSAREAADAAIEVNDAAEAAFSVARRADSKAMLQRLKRYIEDHLCPPFGAYDHRPPCKE